MGAIFISYRRDDSEGHAGRLFEDLAERFGEASVFLDVAGIEPGRDFRKVIDAKVSACGVLLAVMGSRWLEAKDDAGTRRLDDPSDFVRLEIASALRRDIPVVPVLVHGARMPAASQLPPDLADLAYRNAVELTHARWSSDVEVLMQALAAHVGPAAPHAPPVPQAPAEPHAPAPHAAPAATEKPAARSRRRGLLVATAAGAAAVALAGAVYVVAPPGTADTRESIAQLIAQADAVDAVARQSATARLLREFGASPVAVGLAVDQLSETAFRRLSRDGRINVLTYLVESDLAAWPEPARAQARAAVARIEQRVASGPANLGPQVTELLHRLGARLGG